MSVIYIVGDVDTIDLSEKDNVALYTPTNSKATYFSPKLKQKLPQIREIFKNFAGKIDPESKLVALSLGNIIFSFPTCIEDSGKEINYTRFFQPLKSMCEQNIAEHIYIPLDYFSEYLHNPELFEYDLEQEFKSSDCCIYIISSK